VAVFEPRDEGRDEEYGVVGSDEGKPDLFDSSRLLDDGWTPEGWQELWGPEGSRLKPTHWIGHSWNHESWDGHRWRGTHWVGHRWRGHRWWGHRWR
jgi:hypothetical protein